ncbi:MAG: lipoprotein-releasing ABC transporter permease subunit [Candidatus Omnitrophica bacterium]|nr:lipoprotein-releasing ABC transporter permease subunit [Candidatus Omnitrophota bacterium]
MSRPIMRVEAFLAFRYLTRKQRVGFISLITWISVLGMAVGVMALIVVLAVMSGFDAELKQKIVGMQPHVTVQEIGGTRAAGDTLEELEALKVPGVVSIAPFVEGQGIIRSSTNAFGAVVKGIDDKRDQMNQIEKYLIAGSANLSELYKIGEETYPRILMGNSLAWTLQVHLGDVVDVISPHVERRGLLPPKAATMSFVVSGIYAFGMNDFDSALGIVDVKSAQSLFHLEEGRVTGISLRLANVDDSENVRTQLEQTLRKGRLISTWIDQNRNFFAALKVEKTVMTIILSLIILVAAFNIVSSLIMVVLEKTKDIGILQALGLSRARIRSIFLMEGLFIGAVGTLAGALLGLFVAMNLNPIADFLQKTTGIEVFPKDIYYFDKIPAKIQTGDIFVIVSCAFILALLAAWYPSHRASRMLPVEALRYE